MRQAIAVIAFGTTVKEARLNNINPIVDRIKMTYPEYDVYLAFSSRIIVKRLREQGETIQTEEELMKQLVVDGYEKIIAQPLHVIGGEEFDKLSSNIKKYVEGHTDIEVVIGRPLLFFMGQEERPDDYVLLWNALQSSLPIPPEEKLVLVGHGGTGVGNASYSVLQLKLKDMQGEQVQVITLESYPEVDDVRWAWPNDSIVHIHPLLLVAGDHVLNDIFGDDEDSISSVIRNRGYKVKEHHLGLGGYEAIQKIYVKHIEDALEKRYTKRASHRPTIPVIK